MFGQRLRLARKKAGLSMRELAGRMSPKISAQAVSKYESGGMMPSSAVLVGLAKTLDVSMDFLMGGRVEALRGIEFRKHSGTSARDRAKAEAIVTEALEAYLAIEDILGLEPPGDAFGDIAVDRVGTYAEVDALAGKLRERWNLGNDPVPSMVGLLEDRGVRVIEADLPERFDGLACDVVCGGGRPGTAVVVVSSRTGVERKRFNLAHELAHRVVRAAGNPEIRLEKAVDRFAGAFLVPAEHLAGEAGGRRQGMTYRELMRLKRLYGVSAAAMLMRLGQAGVLPQPVIAYAFRSYARSWRREEPEPILDGEGFGAFERAERFEQLVWRALGEQLIPPLRAAQLLSRPLADLEREIRGPRG
ncbi:MAG: XRE family transcriptional regulator [Gammaproteobacteria bacterium]|nr:XRE family transcriptional regulator [Gammaproteobacteria bacterium]